MRRRTLLAATAAALVPLACADGATVACGPVRREPLDPASALHILPDEDPPPYETRPPTSGAHFAVEPVRGVQDEAVSEPMQVTVLEVGGVMLQHRDLDDAARRRLEALAAEDEAVVVAPAPDLDDPVVMTAWVTRQSCSGVDDEVVRTFVAEQRGRGPGAD